jgi:methyltransferase, FkbM family
MNNSIINELKKLYWRRATVLPEAYRRIAYRTFRRSGQVIKRGSVRYRIHDHNDVVGESIYVYGTCAKYVSVLLDAARPFFRTFIDVGANIGSVTVPFAKGFSGKVVSIEPAGSNYALLLENLHLNGLDDGNVVCLRVAIGDRPGKLELFRSQTNSGDHRLAAAADEQRDAELVDVVTLDSIVAGNHELQPPYLVKVDVQGYEAKVLASAQAILRQPCLVIAEFWPYGLRVSGTPLAEFSRVVTDAHLKVYEVSEDRLTIRPSSLAEISESLSSARFEDSRDIILTNMPLADIGLAKFLTA